MGMTSWEEDALFAAWGWEKDLIKRHYAAPDGRHVITFDMLMSFIQSEDDERMLRTVVQLYGVRQNAK